MSTFRRIPTLASRSCTIAMAMAVAGCSLHAAPVSAPPVLRRETAPAPPTHLVVRTTQLRVPVEQVLRIDDGARTAGFTAYDVVRVRRPDFLQLRPAAGRGNAAIGVYIDGTFAGGVDALRDVNANELEAVYRISPVHAATYLGGRHGDGALYLQLRR